MAIGVDWCAVYSDLYNIRIFSLFGTEKTIICSAGNVLAMAGHEEYLAIAYHSATPLMGNQTIRFKVFDGNNNFREIVDAFLPLSPGAHLQSFTYSEGKIFFIYSQFN